MKKKNAVTKKRPTRLHHLKQKKTSFWITRLCATLTVSCSNTARSVTRSSLHWAITALSANAASLEWTITAHGSITASATITRNSSYSSWCMSSWALCTRWSSWYGRASPAWTKTAASSPLRRSSYSLQSLASAPSFLAFLSPSCFSIRFSASGRIVQRLTIWRSVTRTLRRRRRASRLRRDRDGRMSKRCLGGLRLGLVGCSPGIWTKT